MWRRNGRPDRLPSVAAAAAANNHQCVGESVCGAQPRVLQNRLNRSISKHNCVLSKSGLFSATVANTMKIAEVLRTTSFDNARKENENGISTSLKSSLSISWFVNYRVLRQRLNRSSDNHQWGRRQCGADWRRRDGSCKRLRGVDGGLPVIETPVCRRRQTPEPDFRKFSGWY